MSGPLPSAASPHPFAANAVRQPGPKAGPDELLDWVADNLERRLGQVQGHGIVRLPMSPREARAVLLKIRKPRRPA